MSVEAWKRWHDAFIKNPQPEFWIYLTDCRIPQYLAEKLHPILKVLGNAGIFNINQYMKKHTENWKIPDMEFRGYLSPYLPGAKTLTPPHLDGRGTQTSIHINLFSAGYNLVTMWDELATTKIAEDFWKIVDQHPPGVHEGPHYVMDAPFSFDHSETEWDRDKQSLLSEVRYPCKTIRLTAPSLLPLIANAPHTFKKVFPSNCDPIPSVSLACDVPYIGASYAVASKEMAKIFDGHERLAIDKGKPTCMIKICMWLLVQKAYASGGLLELYELEHLHAAYPFLRKMLREEFNPDPARTTERAVHNDYTTDEYACSRCNISLWNSIYVYRKANIDTKGSSEVKGAQFCRKCAHEKPRSQDWLRFLRFGKADKLRAQFDEVFQKFPPPL